MKKYASIGSLILAIKEVAKKNHSEMIDWLDVDPKTYRKWIKGQIKVSEINLQDIAFKTKTPLEVLFRLNNGYITYYNINTHRYATCPFDNDFLNRKVLQKQLFDTNERGNINEIKTDKELREVIGSFFPIYLKENQVEKMVLMHAFEHAPKLNLIIKDHVGYYNGHLICLPLKMDAYEGLRENRMVESSLKRKDIAHYPWNEPIAFHIYSLYATCSTYAYFLIKRFVEFIALHTSHGLHESSYISRYAVTKDGVEFCDKFEMQARYIDYENFCDKKDEITPSFFEARISDLTWVHDYKDQIFKKIYA